MRKENLYYVLSAVSGLATILMAATQQYIAFSIFFIASSLFLLKGLYEDIDNLKY
jgi:hypothetical protein